MIIKINFKDNDFQEQVENYLERITTNVLYDLSYKNYKSISEEEKESMTVKWFEAFKKSNNLLNCNIDYKWTSEDCKWMKDRLKKSLSVYLANTTDIDDISDFMNEVEITFPKAFYDKWENGECCYWFSHSGVVINQ